MASLPNLVTAIAQVDDRERATIDHFARVIREAGFIQTTKRGSGSAAMTVRDAANLLIGLNGAESAKAALLAIPRFRSLRAHYAVAENDEFDGVFARIKEAPTFGDALEAVIEGAGELMLSFGAYVKEAYGPEHVSDFAFGPLAQVRLEVELRRAPVANATIRIVRTPGGEEIEAYAWRFMHDGDLLMSGFYHDRDTERSDRRASVTFGLRTVLRVSAELCGEGGE